MTRVKSIVENNSRFFFIKRQLNLQMSIYDFSPHLYLSRWSILFTVGIYFPFQEQLSSAPTFDSKEHAYLQRELEWRVRSGVGCLGGVFRRYQRRDLIINDLKPQAFCFGTFLSFLEFEGICCKCFRLRVAWGIPFLAILKLNFKKILWILNNLTRWYVLKHLYFDHACRNCSTKHMPFLSKTFTCCL